MIRHVHLLPGADAEKCLTVSPIVFVGDLIAFTVVEDFESASRSLSSLTREITKGKMKVNDTKTKLPIVAASS
eukprot:3500862-Pyramimonas_sp.AAC.1